MAIGLLEARDPAKFDFGADGVRAPDIDLTVADLKRARDAMASFGACSFREPVNDRRESLLR